jgi:hypothetical protein
MEKYRKFIVALIGGGISIAMLLWPGDPTAAKVIQIVTILATAFGVFQVRNAPMTVPLPNPNDPRLYRSGGGY